MARSTTSAQNTALAATDRRTSVRVKVEDPDGVMQDIGDLSNEDFFDALAISATVDDPISSATLTLWRAAAELSLAPLMEGSTLNRSGSTYAPFLDPSRFVTVEIATMLAGQTPSSGDWVMLWEGYIDAIDWASEQITVECRDPISRLNDTIIETTATRGGGSPLADIEDVMQGILNDTMGSGEFPLVVVGVPDFGIKEYDLGNVSVLDALKALADLQGWNLHWKWDATASPEGFFLTYYEPVRNAVDLSGYSPDYTFGTDDYHDVQRLSLAAQGIRNAGEVAYSDSAGADQSVVGSRSSSIATYNRRFIRLDERGGSITTAAQAQALLDAVLDDLEVPRALQRIEAAFHWPIELGDMHRYQANGVHYDVDQDWAVRGYTHVLEPTKVRTLIDVAGKPAGGYARWHKKEATKPEVQQPLSIASLNASFDSGGLAIVSAAGGPATERIYVTVGDGVEPDDPTPTTNDGVITGRSGSVSTGVAISAGNEAHVKAVASSGGNFGAVSETRVSRVVQADGTGDGLSYTDGVIALDIVDLTLDGGPMDAGDSLAFHDDGVGTKRILPEDILVSLFQNDAGYTVGGLETASTGLTAVGTDVQAEYTGGAGSLIGAAPDGTGLGTLGTSDRILFADFGDSFNVKFADLNQLPFESGLTAGVGLGRSGDDFFVQFATEGGIVNSGDALALDIEDLHDWEAADGLAAADKIAMYDVAGDIGNKAIRLDQIDLSLLDNSTSNFTANAIDSASNGLVNVGGDVQPEYGPSASNLVLAADGGLLSALAGADSILVSDASDNVVHHTSLSDLESFLTIGASQITAGTFGAGDYVFPSDLSVAGILAAGLTSVPANLMAGDVLANGGVLAFSQAASNVDHIWHDDASNIFNFVSDAGRQSIGNSHIRLGAGSLSLPALQLGDTDSGLLRVSASILVAVNGVEYFRVNRIDSTHGRHRFQNGQAYVEGTAQRGGAATITLDWDEGNVESVTNDGTVSTIDIDDVSMQYGGCYMLEIEYTAGAVTSFTWTVSGTLKWQSGTAPTLSNATVGDRMWVTFMKGADGVISGFYGEAT